MKYAPIQRDLIHLICQKIDTENREVVEIFITNFIINFKTRIVKLFICEAK